MDAPLKRTRIARFIALAGLLLLGFAFRPLPPNLTTDPALLPSPTATRRPHDTPAPPPTLLFTATPSATLTLISGALSCDTTAPGVTCANYGTYLDYNINIVVEGLTGGATAYDNFIGTFKRADGGGYLGMQSDFWHGETSGYGSNTVLSKVRIQQNGYAYVDYASFTSGAGYDVSVHNQTDEWKDVPGSNPTAQNFLTVRGNVDWPITGYSVVGHIYLYSNQNFMTVTPTMTPSPTPTATATKTPTVTPTSAAQCYGDSCNGLNPQTMGCNVDAPPPSGGRIIYDDSDNPIGVVENRYSPSCLAQWERTRNTTGAQSWAEGSIRWGGIDYSLGIWSAEGVATLEESLYTPMYAVSAGFGPALNCGNLSTSPVYPPPQPINLNSDYGLNNCFAAQPSD